MIEQSVDSKCILSCCLVVVMLRCYVLHVDFFFPDEICMKVNIVFLYCLIYYTQAGFFLI